MGLVGTFTRVYGWNNPAFEEAAAKQLVAVDAAERRRWSDQMQRAIAEDVPMISLYLPTRRVISATAVFSAWYFTPAGIFGSLGEPDNKHVLVTGRQTGLARRVRLLSSATARAPAFPPGPGPEEDAMDDRQILIDTFGFHGHRCWASTAGVRAGLAALRQLGVGRAGGKALQAVVEIGDHHGAMCFADGIQYTTGCTFGKGNIDKTGEGRLAVTLVDKAAGRQVRVAYRPTLQPRIASSAFMRQRAAGVPADAIAESDQWELVDLVWDAPEDAVLSIGPVEAVAWREPDEVVRFATCARCGELVAEPYLRVVEGEDVCLACSGYPR